MEIFATCSNEISSGSLQRVFACGETASMRSNCSILKLLSWSLLRESFEGGWQGNRLKFHWNTFINISFRTKKNIRNVAYKPDESMANCEDCAFETKCYAFQHSLVFAFSIIR